MKMKLQIVPAVLLLLAVGACDHVVDPAIDGDEPRVEFRTDRSVYRHGDEVVRNLTNLHHHAIEVLVTPTSPSYMLLFSEQLVEDEWRPHDNGSVLILVEAWHELAPGEEFSQTFTISDTIYPPGNEYRARAVVRDTRTGARILKNSESFTVVE